MRRIWLPFLLLVFINIVAFSQTVREMRFEEVRLDVVIRSIAKVVNKNVLIDPKIKDVLNQKVSIFIQKPVSINEAFNLIIKEYGLIAVPINETIYKITKAGELELDIKDLTDDDLAKLLELLKRRVSPSAEIVVDKTLRLIYIRDDEKRVKKLEKRIKEYIDKLVAERRLGIEEKPEAVITRVFYLKTIGIPQAKELIAPYMTKETVITEAPTFNALVITDKVDKIQKYEQVLSEFLVSAPAARKPVTEIFYLKYISPDEFIKMIEPIRSEAGVVLTGGAIREEKIGEKDKVRVTPVIKEFNAVMITDYPEVIEKIKEQFSEYISDVPPQVKIEAKILQVDKSIEREIGINWAALLSNVSVPESVSGGVGVNLGVDQPLLTTPGLLDKEGGILTFTYSRGFLNALNLRISAFEKIGKIKSLAKPTVVTVSGQKATIKQGAEIPYQTAVVAGGANVANIQFKEAVLQLDVLPIISPDGRVLLDIKLTKDTIGEDTPVGPVIDTNELSTKVIVNDGDTLVIGGIIDSKDNITTGGVPGLIRVPILKWLFGQESREFGDKELLIFLTPTILYD
jgi:type IV pilus assembly protein PilQ